MHILMTFPFSLGLPGGGNYAFLQTARHLKAAGAAVTVMTLNSPGSKLFLRKQLPKALDGRAQQTTLREKGIEVIPVPVSRLTLATDPIYMRKAVSDYLGSQKVNAVISWHHEGAFLGNNGRKQKIIWGCRAAGNYNRLDPPEKGYLWNALMFRLLQQSFSRADIIWATSDFIKQEVLTNFELERDPLKVLPEGINPIFETVKREQTKNETIRRFIYFGVWSKPKGVFDALSAFKQLTEQGFTEWEFHIAGWGNKEGILQFIQENEMMEQVKLLGKLDHPSLIKALEWAQIAILPSYMESFGLAVAEAQTSGLPVIAYNSGAVPEIIGDGRTGWLVPPKQIDLLADAIKNSMEDPATTHQMGLTGRQKIAGCFSWPKTVKTMLEDIEKLRKL